MRRTKKKVTPPTKVSPSNQVAPKVIAASYEGPFPPPAHLNQYEQILPGAAERIFKFSEREQAHRHNLETSRCESINTQIRLNARADALGRVFGMVLLYACIAVAICCALILENATLTALFLSPPVLLALIKLIQGKTKK